MRNVDSLIFDFNGTLFWDSKYNLSAWNEISLKYRGKPYTIQERKLLDGRTSNDTASFFLALSPDHPKVKEVVEEKENLYAELCLANGKPALAKGAEQLIVSAKEKGYLLAIATSAPKRNMEMYQSWWPVLKEMDVVVCDDGKRRGKPFPDIYLSTFEALGKNPQSTVVFEDSIQGVTAAFAAGADKVWQVVGDTHASPFEKVTGVISDFSEFIPLL